ncbi:MAG: hypothetical protein CMJ70_16305 [Planctomycetaceae bacterium]|nr:hypothetical protein [Planctomycetaceae bacterium]|tara:strand:- start:354 stop:737 length:384 start_codon:yes stop_codon:yes gene_type:complete
MSHSDTQPEHRSLLATLADLLRALCLCSVFVLFALGTWHTLSVFQAFGKIVQNPTILSESVDAISQMIDAETLTIRIAGELPLQPGKVLAFLLLFGWYLVWALLPIQIVAVCSRILLRGFPGGDKKK